AWGMALLAAYSSNNDGRTLEEYLNEVVFAKEEIITLKPSEKGVESFTEYMERYKAVLKVEKAAVNVF
ncbi:MAG TPA: ATPase, partial [Candidatus Dormibacteraeota bacterium]|nr:ATPase [Candidatus Dormibacteraeota bacterium]